MSESTSQASFWMTGFQATLIGCFWVTPEAPTLSCQFGVIAERKRSGWLVVCLAPLTVTLRIELAMSPATTSR
jgi:hypothetical protein